MTLLILFGVGPAASLEKFGIPVRPGLPGGGRDLQDHLGIPVRPGLPGGGRDLQDHLDISICHACTRHLTIYRLLVLDRIVMELARTLVFGTGPAAIFPQEAAAFIRSASDVAVPDVQLHLLPVLADRVRVRPPFVYLFNCDPADGHGYAVRISLLRPHSRGSVELASNDPFAKPRIRPMYFSDPLDLDLLRRAIEIGREILAQPAFRPFDASEIAPGPGAQDDPSVKSWIRQAATTEFHPSSTCRMGQDPMADVDDRLHVIGVECLRVADASIMPTIVGGNTNAPTMMIADKASDFVLGWALSGDR